MTPSQIKQALARAGLKQLDIVKKAGLPKTSRPIVSMVIHGMARSRNIEAIIASSIGKSKEETFPTWYATPKHSDALTAEESKFIIDSVFGTDPQTAPGPSRDLRMIFGLSVAQQTPVHLLGALLFVDNDFCDYSEDFNPYPPSSPHHAGVGTGWRMAQAAMSGAAAPLPGTL